MNDKIPDFLNEQMKVLGATFEQLTSIHESLSQIAEYQEKMAKNLTVLADLLGITVIEKDGKTKGGLII